MNTLLDILKNEGTKISDEFKLASIQGDGTSQEIADFREHAVQDFLSRYYPASQIISKGKITELDGFQSNSIDCLLLNPAHPNLVDTKGKFRLIFADGCDAAIEVKPDLSRTDEIHRALKQGITVKKAKRSESPLIRPTSHSTEILEHSLHIPFFIFCIKAFDVKKLHSVLINFYIKHNVPTEHQVDAIFILDEGVVVNIKHKERNWYGVEYPIGKNTGWYFENWDKSSLLGMLFAIERAYKSQPLISKSIMSRVLLKLVKFDVTRLTDLQETA